jgi:hypothetical protein
MASRPDCQVLCSAKRPSVFWIVSGIYETVGGPSRPDGGERKWKASRQRQACNALLGPSCKWELARQLLSPLLSLSHSDKRGSLD